MQTLPEAQRTQGIDSITWIMSPAKKNSNSVDKKSQVKKSIGSNFSYQVAPLVLPHCLWLPYWHHQLVLSCYLHQPTSHQLCLQKVSQWVWKIKTHHLHWFQSWPQGCVTCIATLPWSALSALSVGIELVSSSASATSVKSAQTSLSQWVSEWETTGPIDWTPGTPGSDKH